jgi:hypothetical protein
MATQIVMDRPGVPAQFRCEERGRAVEGRGALHDLLRRVALEHG